MLVGINLVALVVAAGVVAGVSATATVGCGEQNCCDGMVFRGVGEILAAGGEGVYRWETLQAWWRATTGSEPLVVLPFAYPPPALPLFHGWALGASAPATGAVVAAGSMAAFLAVAAALGGGVVAVAAGLGGWAFFSAWLAQTGLLLGAAGGLVLLGLQRRSALWGGLGLAVLCLKPHYGAYPALGLLVAGRWRELGVAAGVLAGLSALSAGLYGPAQWLAWVQAITEGVGGGHPALDFKVMTSWVALVPGGPELARVGLVLWGLGLVPVVWVWRRRTPAVALATTLLLALLLTPHGHPYDLSLWLVPSLVLWPRDARPLLGLGAVHHVTLFLHARFAMPLTTLWLLWRVGRMPVHRESP